MDLRTLTLLTLAALLVPLGCSTDNARSLESAASLDELPASFNLPPFPTVPAPRDDAAAYDRERDGDEYYLKSDNAVVDGYQIELNSAPGELSWAIFQFQDVFLDIADSWLEFEYETPGDAAVYIGFSDYSRDAWAFQRVDISSGNTPGIAPIPVSSPYTDPSGTCYVATCTWGGDYAKLGELELFMGVPDVPPAGVTATDGVYPDRILIAWEEVEYSRGYVLEYKRSDADESAWTYLMFVDSGFGTSHSHVYSGTPGTEPEFQVQYDYRIRTRFRDGDESPNSNVASGYRDLGRPWNVKATRNHYPDKVVVIWNEVPGAEGYLVHRSADGVDYEYIDATTDVTFADETLPDHADYYYMIKAEVSDGQSIGSLPAVGSTLGWYISPVNTNVAWAPDCDLTVIDGRLAASFKTSSPISFVVAHAQVVEPHGAADWELSTVSLSTSLEYPTIGDFNGMPALSWYAPAGPALSFAAATSHTPGSGYDFTYSTVIVRPSAEFSFPVWRLYDGVPVVAYRARGPGLDEGIYLAWSSEAIPDADEDWHNYLIVEASDFTDGHTLLTGHDELHIAYSGEDESQVHVAYCPGPGTPTSSDSWSSYLLFDFTFDYRNLKLFAGPYQHPILASQVIPDATRAGVTVRTAQKPSPTQASDWEFGGTMGTDDDWGDWLDACTIDGRPALCFFDANANRLMFAWAREAHPGPTTEWVVTTVGGSQSGKYCAMVELNGMPMIIFWNTFLEAVILARGL